jgi:hypothetical protein
MSSSLKKQITIDAISGGNNNTTLKRQKKVKPPAALIRPSTARYNLLQKIKDYQNRNEETPESQQSQSSQSSQQSQSSQSSQQLSDNDLANQYKSSATYLEQLINKKKDARKQKSPKASSHKMPTQMPVQMPAQMPAQMPTMQMHAQMPTMQMPAQMPAQMPTMQLVSLELPPELQLNPIQAMPQMMMPQVMPQVMPQMMMPQVIHSPNPIQTMTEAPINTNANTNANTNPNPIVLKDVPYGCLRGGNKPTYRTYHRGQNSEPHNTTLKKPLFHNSNNSNISNNSNNNELADSASIADPMIQERQRKLREIQSNFYNQTQTQMQTQTQTQSEPSDPHPAPSTKLVNKIKQTITKKYKLGKAPGGNVVGVLIKNSDTRRRIQEEHGVLQRESIVEIRKYLHDHGLIKVGSDAPPDVLRNLYESAKMTGEISNTNKHVMLHNFLKSDENSSVT